MSAPSLKLQLERLLIPETYESDPHTLELSPNEWEAWFQRQQQKVTWRLKAQQDNSRSKVLWTQRWECDHAGSPRDRCCGSLLARKEYFPFTEALQRIKVELKVEPPLWLHSHMAYQKPQQHIVIKL
ncbi:hypothetical protein M422DRAFT_264206 [Sphaerobolus stellatus SS14]|uniref:Uncharacterized protein n=1 Tax=Sphaerobolus stellatus (strain SS14) TaxID=990650 RepID=A0A0C9UWU2_SPHS4|nr:hypothetical protein M422DRAFT_264206 [Sphaerobolus stellatus SS14]